MKKKPGYQDLYKIQKAENYKLKVLIHTFFNDYKKELDKTSKKLDTLINEKKKKGGKMIGKIFAFIAGFFAGTIFGHLAVGIIIEWLKAKGGII